MKKYLSYLLLILLVFNFFYNSFARRIKTSHFHTGSLKYNGVSLIVPSNYEEMSRLAVELLLARLKKLVTEKGSAVIALPTGNTPLLIYEILRNYYRSNPIWNKVTLVQIDEYIGASPEEESSFQFQLRKNLVEYLPFKKFIAINGAAEDIAAERERYERAIKKLGGIDIIFLGIGINGHVAFHEPGLKTEKSVEIVELHEVTRKANNVPYSQAITITLNEILKAKEIFLISSAKKKRNIISEALNGDISYRLPASLLRTHSNTTFIVDRSSINEETVNILSEKIKEEILEYLKGREIKIFATDLDFILTPINEGITEQVAEKLTKLAKNGIHIALLTGSSYKTVKRIFLDRLPDDFPWQNLSLYCNFGADAYRFSSQKRLIRIYPRIEMLDQQVKQIEAVIEEFKKLFPQEFVECQFENKVKATLILKPKVRTIERYNEMLDFLSAHLSKVGLFVNGSGHLDTIDISSTDKSYGLFNLRDRLNVSFSQITYVADAFAGKYGSDVPTIIQDILLFNVGFFQDVPSAVYSLALYGDLGTQVLIDAIIELKKGQDNRDQ